MVVFATRQRIERFKKRGKVTMATTDLDDAVMGIVIGDEEHRNRELLRHLVPIAGGKNLHDVVASSALEVP
jgi:hypothetical protein